MKSVFAGIGWGFGVLVGTTLFIIAISAVSLILLSLLLMSFTI